MPVNLEKSTGHRTGKDQFSFQSQRKWKWSRSVVSDSLLPHGPKPGGSSIHGILQARLLQCIAIFFSRGSSQPRDWTQVSRSVSDFSKTNLNIKNENWPFPVLWLTAEFSKFAGILSAALSEHRLSGFEIAQLEFHHLQSLALFIVMLSKAHLTIEESRENH